MKKLLLTLLVLIIISLDNAYFGIYNKGIHQALILVSIVPLAVNTVVVASLFNIQPEKAATAVLLSTIFALIYVPLMVNWFI